MVPTTQLREPKLTTHHYGTQQTAELNLIQSTLPQALYPNRNRSGAVRWEQRGMEEILTYPDLIH